MDNSNLPHSFSLSVFANGSRFMKMAASKAILRRDHVVPKTFAEGPSGLIRRYQ